MPEVAYAPDPRAMPLQFTPSRRFGRGAQQTATSTMREIVTSARTYYVSSSGSDSATGLSQALAFATLSKAVSVVHGLDISENVAITIQLVDGNHTISAQVTLRNLTGIGSCVIQGNAADAGAVTLTAGVASITMLSFAGTGPSRWTIQHLTMVGNSANTGIGVDATSRLTIGNLRWTTGFTQAITCINNSFITMNGSAYTISGSMTQFILCQRAGWVLAATTGTWTVSGSPTFTAFITVLDQGAIRIASTAVTFSGSAAGARYFVSSNSIIQTNGGGATYLPGDANGTAQTGGQYE